MPYSDPAKRREARREQYRRKRRAQLGTISLWTPADMLLAIWCVQLRRKTPELEAIWRVPVPIVTYPIIRGTGRVSDRLVHKLGTKIMMRLDGEDYQLCEFENENVLPDLVKEREEFYWGFQYHLMRIKEARRAGHKRAQADRHSGVRTG